MLSSLRGLGLKDRVLHPHDQLWDLRLGIATFGYRPAVGEVDAPDFRVHYTPAPYATVFRMLHHVRLGAGDVFADLGCGLGRSVFSALWLGARSAVGVEIDAGLVEAANRNLARASGRWRERRVEFVRVSAEAYEHPDTTVIFMFHPFGAGTMAGVVRRLEAALARRPRDLRIAYLNPVHGELLDASPRLLHTGHWPAPAHPHARNARYAVGFWAARGTMRAGMPTAVQ